MLQNISKSLFRIYSQFVQAAFYLLLFFELSFQLEHHIYVFYVDGEINKANLK